MSNILLLDSGTQALAILKNLHQKHKIFLFGKKGNYADSSKYITRFIDSSKGKEFETYVEKIIHIILKYNIDVIIPMSDYSAQMISRHKNILKKYVKFNSPDYGKFLNGYDKNLLMKLCANKSYPHPFTLDLSHLNLNSPEIKNFPFPALIKPNHTTGGRGMMKINSYEDFVKFYPQTKKEFGECHLQQFIYPGGKQVKVQLFVNKDGDLLASSVLHKVRYYPVTGGSSSCCVTIKDDKLIEICQNLLNDLKWEGFADFDLIEDPFTKELLIMEINPRLPACIGAAIAGGVDWGNLIVDFAENKEIKKFNYKEGVQFRHLGFDILWFFKSPLRLKTKPSWFKFIGKNIYYQDFHFIDQKPFWNGTFNNFKKLLNPNFRKLKKNI